jgi:hypothetical protein
MNAHRLISAIVVCALVALTVILAAWRGLPEGAVFAAVVGFLLIAYLVRHAVRSRLLYDRFRAASQSGTHLSADTPAVDTPQQALDAGVRDKSSAA